MGASVLAKTLDAVRGSPPSRQVRRPSSTMPHTTETMRHTVGTSRSTARPRGLNWPAGERSSRGGSWTAAICSRRYMGPKSRPVRATTNTIHSIRRA